MTLSWNGNAIKGEHAGRRAPKFGTLGDQVGRARDSMSSRIDTPPKIAPIKIESGRGIATPKERASRLDLEETLIASSEMGADRFCRQVSCRI
jgi:hypothetical protein